MQSCERQPPFLQHCKQPFQMQSFFLNQCGPTLFLESYPPVGFHFKLTFSKHRLLTRLKIISNTVQNSARETRTLMTRLIWMTAALEWKER